jgi:hypothetical protein
VAAVQAEIVEALNAELDATPARLDFEIIDRQPEGTLWKVFVDLEGPHHSALDDSLEGTPAWWPGSATGTAEVLSVLPERQQINLRFATRPPPPPGQRLSLFPPRCLAVLKSTWHNNAWATSCEKWWDLFQGGAEGSQGAILDAAPFCWLRSKQRDAFRLTGHAASFLWGPPGTGKTTTLGALMARFLSGSASARVLLLSTTNGAVDQSLVSVDRALEELGDTNAATTAGIRNACCRVGKHYLPRYYEGREHLLPVKDPTLVRELTALEALRPDLGRVREYAQWKQEVEAVKTRMSQQTTEVLPTARLAAMTTTRAVFRLSDLRKLAPYDLIAFDEAGQVGLAHALALAPLGKQLIFAGDPKQLAPIVQAKNEAAKKWLGRSMFDVAPMHSAATCMLDEQSRMASPICSLVSAAFYDGKLRVATDSERNSEWRRDRELVTVRGVGDSPVALCWVSEPGSWSQRYGGPIRFASARAIADLVSELLTHLEPKDILVLTPFRAQRALIRQLLAGGGARCRGVSVSTVHRAQGRECHTVFFDPAMGSSPVLTTPSARRLVNVALSRAQARLVVFLADADRANPLLEQISNLISAPNRAEQAVARRTDAPKAASGLTTRTVPYTWPYDRSSESGFARRTLRVPGR